MYKDSGTHAWLIERNADMARRAITFEEYGLEKKGKNSKSLRTEINSQVMSDVGFLIINHPAA